jgi:hypothetical protein
MATKKFQATVESVGVGDAWCRVNLPFDVEQEYGSRGRVSVRGTIGGFAFRSSIFPNGDGTHHVMVNKAMRDGAGAKPGDTIAMTLEKDTEARVVAAPDDLAAALARKENAKASDFFEALAPGYQKRWVDLLVQAKKPETRAKRVETIVQKLASGMKAPS